MDAPRGDGAPETLWDVADRAGVPPPAQTPKAQRAKYVFDWFAQFLGTMAGDARALRRRDRLSERMVDDHIAEARRQNVR
ncbi:MAG TPA: hypothetical protein VKV73_25705 [Chloroflexota bacterium]|nr:hypothetical protein [Chloroflexota bacterium]